MKPDVHPRSARRGGCAPAARGALPILQDRV